MFTKQSLDRLSDSQGVAEGRDALGVLGMLQRTNAQHAAQSKYVHCLYNEIFTSLHSHTHVCIKNVCM